MSTKIKSKIILFFSADIIEFLTGFKTLKEKLSKIGCNLKGKKEYIPKNNSETNYIIWPIGKGINKDKDNWAAEKNAGNYTFKQEEAQIGRVRANRLKNEEYIIDENEYDEEEEEIRNDNNNKINNLIDQDVEIENIKIMDIDDNRFDDNMYKEDDDNEIKSEENNIKKENENKIKIGKITDNLISIDPIDINESNFKEEDGIKRALMVLEEEKKKKYKNQILDLGNYKKSHKFSDLNIFNINKKEKLNILQL